MEIIPVPLFSDGYLHYLSIAFFIVCNIFRRSQRKTRKILEIERDQELVMKLSSPEENRLAIKAFPGKGLGVVVCTVSVPGACPGFLEARAHFDPLETPAPLTTFFI